MNVHTRASEVEARTQRLRVEFKTALSDLPPLAERWEALNRRLSDHDAPFFQSYAWNHHVAGVRARCSSGHYKLLVATVWRGESLIGLWPLALRRSAGAWIARNLDDPFGQFAGVCFQDREDIGPGVAAVLTALRGVSDGLQIDGVTGGSALHAALSEFGARTAASQQAVFVDLKAFPTFKAFEQSVKGSTRKVLRKRAEKMRQTHAVEDVVTTDPVRLAPLTRDVFETRLQWLQRNGRTSPAFRDDAFKALVDGLVDAEGIEVVGFALQTQTASIAAQLGFIYAGRFYGYMTSKNADYDEFSPGRQLYKMVIEGCFERSVKVLELMSPASSDKLEWTGELKQVETMVMPFSIKGNLVLQFTHRLMPAAQRFSRTLPESLRKSLIRRLNRA